MAISDSAPRAVILMLCGLPAAGKTSLVYQLQRKKESLLQQFGISSLIVHIQYDKLFPDEGEKVLITDDEWKIYRSKIRKCVQQILQRLLIDKEVPEITEEDVRLQEKFSNFVIPQIKDNYFLGKCLILVIDDNMYYKSMRYEYYQLAKMFSIGFAIIHIETTVEQCFINNDKRAGSELVSKKIIQDMKEKFENPNCLANSWERHLVVLQSHVILDTRTLRDIGSLIWDAASNPAEDLSAEEEAAREESRRVCLKNLKHQTDQILRMLIGGEMKALPEKDRKAKAGFFISLKAQLLKDLVKGKLAIGENLIQGETGPIVENPLYEAVKVLFYDYYKNREKEFAQA